MFTGCWVVCILTLGVLAPVSSLYTIAYNKVHNKVYNIALWTIGLTILRPILIGFAGVARNNFAAGDAGSRALSAAQDDRLTRQPADRTQRPVSTISAAHPYVKPIAIRHDNLSPTRRANPPSQQRISRNFGADGYRQDRADKRSFVERSFIDRSFVERLCSRRRNGVGDCRRQRGISGAIQAEIYREIDRAMGRTTSPSGAQFAENHDGARPYSTQPTSLLNAAIEPDRLAHIAPRHRGVDQGDRGKRSACDGNRHRKTLHDGHHSGERAYKGNRVTLQQVLVHALWVVGLSGLLATFSFAGWQRRSGGVAHRLASRLFVPTVLSLVAVCTGALLNGFLHSHTTTSHARSWWGQAAWGLLLFILILLLAADRISSRGYTGWGKARLGFIDGGEDL